jgi:hypothetical protein
MRSAVGLRRSGNRPAVMRVSAATGLGVRDLVDCALAAR